MKILGLAEGEFGIERVEARLKEAGLYGRYEAQIRGQQGALVLVRVRNVAEKEQVRGIFESSGVIEISYREEELPAAPTHCRSDGREQ